MAAAAPRRRKIIGHRRRVEDEGEEDAGPEVLDLDDDSLTDGSIGTDENDAADDSDTSNIDEASPTSPTVLKSKHKSVGNGAAKPSFRRRKDAASEGAASPQLQPVVTDTEIMLNRLSLADKDGTAEELNFDEMNPNGARQGSATKDAAPIVVSSSSATRQQQPPGRVPPQEIRRREHEEYRRKRDEDPTFVPNRGNFFLHDHRHAGPAANGFRPFSRGARGGRGRGAFGGSFAPTHPFQNVSDPTTNAPWTHDMHEAVAQPPPQHHRTNRFLPDNDGPPNGNGIISTAPPSKTSINRAMSTEKHLGNVTIRVFITPMKAPTTIAGVPMVQYTKLPDHRPPLRRDKPVRISLPYHDHPLMPRYIFPSSDRSFIFIPRAMRPNQQRVRGKGPRSVLGSIGGFSRRTSMYGGSYYAGSAYSPSIAMSRRSSIAQDIGRDFILSPTGSAISRAPMPMDNNRPVVRLPPLAQPQGAAMPMMPSMDSYERAAPVVESSISDFPQPQTHPLPQKPIFQENRPTTIPMHQPRPQKTVSVENIESPAQQMNAPQAYQQAFHQQVPQMNGYAQDTHARRPSYPSQLSGTPLSQIPERAIHAAPFQPNTFAQPGFYGQPYPMMQPQPGYYYPQQFPGSVAPNAGAPAFVPATQQGPLSAYNPSVQGEAPGPGPQANGQAGAPQGLVAQEMNGMVYYYESSQLPPITAFPSFPASQAYAPGLVGMVTPGQFYQPPAPMVYYSQ
ncbi:CASC3/Barentsz eIF4AIII binding-domain-containing protein [Cercophora scortea]|uniref:CASC3/Barentsz eIF4AIII binding-domain-containing protein n=1 Tax=Cercophora scortea TaxID=314031 RepID=A0AAE0MCI1_9PEZI|nr:CASC3/Barentsz eIF4AIII binding-domain-containing protein [Cercophora scortea]